MCNLISWIEIDKNIYVITDAEIKSERGQELILECGTASDIWGHGFCREYYRLKGGIEKEVNDFSKLNLFPDEIQKLLKDFDKNFGHMFSLYVPNMSALTSLPEGVKFPQECGYLHLSALTKKDRDLISKKYGY